MGAGRVAGGGGLGLVAVALIVWALTLVIGFTVAYFLAFHVQSVTMQMTLALISTIPFWTSNVIRMISWIPLLGRNISHSDEQHDAIVEAILAGDAGAAADAMCAHLAGSAALLQGPVAQAIVDKYAKKVEKWDGPTTGPKAQSAKTIVNLVGDMKNGGHLGVTKGIEEAAAAIGWEVKTIDGAGSVAGRTAAMGQAMALNPSGDRKSVV